MKNRILKTTGIILGIIGIYLLAVVILPMFHTSPREAIHAIKEINIYVKSNGVHTDIVLPIKNKVYDWSNKIEQKFTIQPDTTMQYIATGWGDKGFYLNTPTWADLTAKTAFNAAFGLSTTAMHTTFYKEINESDNCIKISLTKEEYLQLCDYVNNSFQTNTLGEFLPLKTNANYGLHDCFYEANGTYSVFKSCNTWTNKALKTANQKACFWTITDKGILNIYK